MVLDADARVRYASPNAVSALHRVGHQRQRRRAAPGRARLRRRHGAGRPSSASEPVIEEFEQTPEITLLTRCIPHPRRRRGDGRRAARARRDRAAPPGPAAAVEGRHDPRDPPPGEEQPADDLVAAAPPGPAADVARGQGGDRRVGAAHPHDRPRPRDAVAGGRRRRRRSSRSCGRWSAWPRRACSRPTGRCGSGSQGDGGKLPAADRHAAGGRAHRAAPERRRPRLPPGGRAGSRGRRCWPTTARTLHVRVVDDGVGLPAGLRPRAAPPGSGCRSCARWSPPSWPARSRCARATPTTSPPSAWTRRQRGTGTVVELRDPGCGRRPLSRCRLGAGSRRRAAQARGGRLLAGDVGPPELAALLLGGAAPDARVLVRRQRELRGTSACTGHDRGTRSWPARSGRARAPVVPTGKNRSGSVSRQAACRRQL